MNQQLSNTCRSPTTTNEPESEARTTKSRLAVVGVRLSAFAIAAIAIILGLAFIGILDIAWGSSLPLGLMFFVCVPCSVLGGFVSLVAVIVHRSWFAGFSLFMGIVATIASLATVWLLVMVAAATNPV